MNNAPGVSPAGYDGPDFQGGVFLGDRGDGFEDLMDTLLIETLFPEIL
jgi:hypothetical protein